MPSDLHVCFAEGEGLEPPSPFGQRFSSPLTASSRNVDYAPRISLLAGQREERDFLALPDTHFCF